MAMPPLVTPPSPTGAHSTLQQALGTKPTTSASLTTASLHSELALVWNNWEHKKCFNNLAGGLP